MNKELIAKRFSKNLSTYNDNAKVQQKMAERLVSYLDKDFYSSILEIGCGTGILTKIINENIEYDNYTANDIVQECAQYIKNISSEIIFSPCDIEELIKNQTQKFDLIISNATFQWIDDLEKFVKNLKNILNPNGIILFSTFGTENFREICYIADKGLKYHSLTELKDMFSNTKAEIEEEIRLLSFSTPKDVLKHIKYTGVNALEQTHWTKKDIARFENQYNNFCSGHPTLTYNPIYIKITNEE